MKLVIPFRKDLCPEEFTYLLFYVTYYLVPLFWRIYVLQKDRIVGYMKQKYVNSSEQRDRIVGYIKQKVRKFFRTEGPDSRLHKTKST
jgi:hypothetical protein